MSAETFEYQSGLWSPEGAFEVTISGFVRGEVERKTSRAGKPYSRFTVRVKGDRANPEDKGSYYTVMAFGRTGEQAEWLQDGERVLVTGGLDRRPKDKGDGYWLTIMARAIGRDLNQPLPVATNETDDAGEPF